MEDRIRKQMVDDGATGGRQQKDRKEKKDKFGVNIDFFFLKLYTS